MVCSANQKSFSGVLALPRAVTYLASLAASLSSSYLPSQMMTAARRGRAGEVSAYTKCRSRVLPWLLQKYMLASK